MITTGRTLDEHGQPIPGTGFEMAPGGELAGLLGRRAGALTSHPTQAVWSAPLPGPEDEPDTIRSVGVHKPGFDGPPEHYHEQSVERFEILAGDATFHIDGEDVPVSGGDTITVGKHERHSFTIEGDDLCYMVVDIRSPGRLRHVLPTLGGLAHDEARNADDPLQQALLAQRLAGNTVFTEIDETIATPLRAALAPLALLRGYQGAYAKYTQDAFWERHVEQPDR